MSSKKLVQVWYHLKQEGGKAFSDSTVDKVYVKSTADIADLRKAIVAENADGLLKGISASQLKAFKSEADLEGEPLKSSQKVTTLGQSEEEALLILVPEPRLSCSNSQLASSAKKRKAVDEIIEDADDEQEASAQKVVHVYEYLAKKLNISSRLMKRSCYEKLRDILVSEKAEWDKKKKVYLPLGMKCEVYLTGTPGIGKTAFLTWLIKYLLRHGYRIVFGCREFKGQWAEMRYTKSNNEKKHLKVNILSDIGLELEKDTNAWMICDSVEVSPFNGMTIFCSSPREEVSKQFKKRALELTMPVWTYDEILECRNLIYSRIIDVAYLCARFFFLGGVPRLIFTNISKTAVEIIKDAVISSPVDKLKRYSSDYTAAMILLKYQQEAASTIVNFFYDTSYIGPLGGLRGHNFEILANPVIASGGPFKCRKLSPDGPAESTVSNGETAFKISFAVDNVSYVDSMEESKGLKNTVVIPRSKNFESVDSWFIDDSNVASSFHFTVSESHSFTSAVYTYGKQINLNKYYTVVFNDLVFKNYRYSNVQVSKKEEHMNSEPCNIEQFVLQIPIPDKIEPGIVFDQIKSQFEAFVPKETWSPRVKVEYDLAFHGIFL